MGETGRTDLGCNYARMVGKSVWKEFSYRDSCASKRKKKEIFALWHEADYEDSQVEILRPYLHCVLNAEKIKAGCTLLTCQSQVKKKIEKKRVEGCCPTDKQRLLCTNL